MNTGELSQAHAPLRGAERTGGLDRWVRVVLRRFPPATLIRASGARCWYALKPAMNGYSYELTLYSPPPEGGMKESANDAYGVESARDRGRKEFRPGGGGAG